MHLRAATEAQKRARDVVGRQAWDPSLGEADFLAREAALRAHPWTREVMTTWLWVDAAGEALSSCETFRVPSRVGEEPGFSWQVASVFTEPSKRGQGAALGMMQALVARLRGEPGAQASTLYSEVGAKLYERAGYLSVPSTDVVLPPRDGQPEGLAWSVAPPVPLAPSLAAGTLGLVPTAEELDWHLERERFYAHLRGLKTPAFHGARRGPSSVSFVLVPKTNEVAVLWLDAAAEDDVAPLLAAAQHTAAFIGAARVRVWEATPLPRLPGAKRVARDDALPMFAPLREGVTGWQHIHRGLWV